MKTYKDRLRGWTLDELKACVEKDSKQIEIMLRDISTMKEIIKEKEAIHDHT